MGTVVLFRWDSVSIVAIECCSTDVRYGVVTLPFPLQCVIVASIRSAMVNAKPHVRGVSDCKEGLLINVSSCCDHY